MCCFKSLRLWKFVKAATRKSTQVFFQSDERNRGRDTETSMKMIVEKFVMMQLETLDLFVSEPAPFLCIAVIWPTHLF